jgi:uncharacterized linocin/CFP29 family protein
LHRDLAPISSVAWDAIEREVRRALTTFLDARRIVDFSGPHGYTLSALDLGRTGPAHEVPGEAVSVAVRRSQPLVELRRRFDIPWVELDAIDRGATAIDLDPAIQAARAIAMVEDSLVFHGMNAAEIDGIVPTAEHEHEPLPLGADAGAMPPAVAQAMTVLRHAGVEGPYALVLGTRCYTQVIEGTEGGYPVLEHLRLVLDGGTVTHAPALEGALLLSLRGGDFELVVGEDLSLGYADHTSEGVTFFLEETLLFRVNGPEAAVALPAAASLASPSVAEG